MPPLFSSHNNAGGERSNARVGAPLTPSSRANPELNGVRGRLPPVPPLPPLQPLNHHLAPPAAATLTVLDSSSSGSGGGGGGGAVAGDATSFWIPSRLPFRCTSVMLRGGPLLQGSEVECHTLQLDLHKAILHCHLKWSDSPDVASALAAASPNAASCAPATAAEPAGFTSPPNATAHATNTAATASSKKRVRVEEETEEEQHEAHHGSSNTDTLSCSGSGSSHNNSPLVSPAPNPFTGFSTPLPAALSIPLMFSSAPEQPPASKRGRTDERTLPAGAGLAHTPNPLSSSNKSVWSIPLSRVVGVDFAVSLDQPATCTLALKPHSVYSADEPPVRDVDGMVITPSASAHAHTQASLAVPTTRRHARHPSGSVALANLPLYSPARILVSSYQNVAARNPEQFTPVTRALQKFTPPLLFWVWLHSTYFACAFLMLGALALHTRFWLTGSTCLLVYLILLLQEFRRSQDEFKHRLHLYRSPQDECMYVHIVFAEHSHPSFLSFRRLFVAAAPTFSTPSASSSGATALIPPSLPLPSTFLWAQPRSNVPQRYPISHLQNVLPVAPLFFGNVYVESAPTAQQT